MIKMGSEDAYQNAMRLIEAQLSALPTAMAAALNAPGAGKVTQERWEGLLHSRRNKQLPETGSVGNIVADAAPPNSEVEMCLAQSGPADAALQTDYLRVVIGNALLAVGMFLKEHDMAAMRTPEIQFLDHVCDAILAGNRFTLDPGYMPIATFEGLTIDEHLDGALLFDQQKQQGFMGWGDAVALLQWLLRYFKGTRQFVTGGDAG